MTTRVSAGCHERVLPAGGRAATLAVRSAIDPAAKMVELPKGLCLMLPLKLFKRDRKIVNTHRSVRFVTLILLSAVTWFGTSAFAEDANLGKMEYESSCAACHGQNGNGDGPVSTELRTKPSDLTLIAKKNGGVFPADVLYRIIDGRRTVRAHGTYEMPVWGSVFLSSGPENVGRNRILAIISYLKSIQQ